MQDKKHKILFKTIHGSRLYNLHHENSDYDYYTVIEPVNSKKKKWAKQSIVGDQDSMVIDLGTWLHQCSIGVPQALEAMFSPLAEIDRIETLRSNFYVGSAAWERYLRTIKSFARSEVDQYKRKRHSLRLALNLKDLRKYERFSPVLSEDEKMWISDYAHNDSEDVYAKALEIVWSNNEFI